MKGQMKRILGLKGWATLLAGALVLGSCVEDEVLENQDDLTPKKSISFNAVVDWPEDYIEGRGAVLTDKANLTSFNVWATLNRAAGVSGDPIAYFSDIAFNKGTDEVYSSAADQTYYWPGEGPTLEFVAVGNKPASNFVAGTTSNKVTSFTYTVPTAATAQNDVVVATTPVINGDNVDPVPLTFNHIMSAINVSVGTDMGLGTINSVKFTGIKNKGIYNVASPAWAIASDATTPDYPVASNYAVSAKPSAVTKINDGTATLMLLPQEFTADAQIVVNFTPTGGTAQDFTASLKDQLTGWEMGHAYNYVLNIDPSIGLSLTVAVQDWTPVSVESAFAQTPSVGKKIVWDTDINDDGTADYDIQDDEVILNEDINVPAKFTFQLTGPKGGEWIAYFVKEGGVSNAFTLNVEGDDSRDVTCQGKVGEGDDCIYTIEVRAKGVNNTSVTNKAELRFMIRQAGQLLPVDALTTLSGSRNYKILQNPPQQ